MKKYLNHCAKCKTNLSSFDYHDSSIHIQKCEAGQKLMERFF